MTTPRPARWIDLTGVANMRDVGGLPTHDGRTIAERRLIRSDNLQTLTDEDVRHLLDEVGVSDVIDLRSQKERAYAGPGPLAGWPVRHHHHSFLADDRREVSTEQALAMPWLNADDESEGGDYWTRHYLSYLRERPDSVAGALTAVAQAPGAAIVHCAAGKDRTGTVVAMALSVAGVPDEEIIADYVRSAERIEAIIGRLMTQEPYSQLLPHHSIDETTPRAETMESILAALREEYGGSSDWLLTHGWEAEDIARLRSRLLD
ncbi:tyrosine-protein phosphatase [Janibacter sp. GXQ6167]|uniref:tyrosine-protein phosphatase n=1 Tax=Janibacter sp. GXQ6167 TaxID=3240791 RepID=UPI003525AF7F